jgi:hypothetical protein
MQKSISVPNISNLKPVPRAHYDPSAQVVTGLEAAFKKGKKAIACASNGVKEEWFSCTHDWDAEPIFKKYHAGLYITLKWFIEK